MKFELKQVFVKNQQTDGVAAIYESEQIIVYEETFNKGKKLLSVGLRKSDGCTSVALLQLDCTEENKLDPPDRWYLPTSSPCLDDALSDENLVSVMRQHNWHSPQILGV